MRIIVKLFPEITIKSASVRLLFIKILTKNISVVLKFFNFIKKIIWHWDHIEILLNKDDSTVDIVKILMRIPGIHHILLVEKYCFQNMYDIFKSIIPIYRDVLVGRSFCVRVKRHGKHNFTSSDLECYLGDMLCSNIKDSFVKLVGSKEVIGLEVKENYFLLLRGRYQGLRGFPIGTQGSVLSLISGGFDSGVASYMLMRRGCKVHYCCFNFGGDLHTNGVYKIANYLWRKFGCSHSVKFISVDFSLVLSEILKNISVSYMGIVLKRMMIRAATLIAKSLKISTLSTGEVLGQVSSQTLVNLKLINDVTDIMVFRPLISYDKEDIVLLSREIGIEDFSIAIPEYCGMISKKPTAKGCRKNVEWEEKKFDFSILNTSVNQRDIRNIYDLIKEDSYKNHNFRFVNKLNNKYIIIDIRVREEQEKDPLYLDTIEIQKIPFYRLLKIFSTLDQSKMYLLYCGKGIMSHCQVLYLRDQGFKNVDVYLHGERNISIV